MAEPSEGLLGRAMRDPRIPWFAAALIAFGWIPPVMYFGLKAPEGGSQAIAWGGIALALINLVLAAGIIFKKSWAYVISQWIAGLGIVGAAIAIFKIRETPAVPGAMTPFFPVVFILFNALVLTLVSIGKPAAVLPFEAATGRRKETDPLEWTRDNIEAIVVAFLMALIIRCFCIEVFKIPTGSMEPTLYGDTKPGEAPPAHQGDRIMVDKIGLMTHGVNRFDVCVFKYPLDRSRNFIKRIVGLPDEDLDIDHGDIWTRPHSGGDQRFRIARKPAHEQVGIWLPVWPGDDVSAEACKKMWDGAPAGCYASGAVFDTGPAKGEATFGYQRDIQDYYRGAGTHTRVNDLVVRFKATLASGAELFVTDARGDGYGKFTVFIKEDGTVRFSHTPDERGTFTPLPMPAPISTRTVIPGADVEASFCDGAVRVRIRGIEVAAWEYVDVLPDELRQADAPRFPISFGSKGGAVKFEGVWLGRDIQYNRTGRSGGDSVMSGKEFLPIPKERYLAIGDNVCNSKDGRLWKERTVKLKNGTKWTGDGDSPENYPQTRAVDGKLERFRDTDGTDHFFAQEDVEDEDFGERIWQPFVSREEFVGKALVVWYPLARFKVIR